MKIRAGTMAMMTLVLFGASSTLSFALFAGCSSTSDGWAKAGMTKEQLEQDTASCLLNARATVPSREGPRNCMADRGYTAGPTR